MKLANFKFLCLIMSFMLHVFPAQNPPEEWTRKTLPYMKHVSVSVDLPDNAYLILNDITEETDRRCKFIFPEQDGGWIEFESSLETMKNNKMQSNESEEDGSYWREECYASQPLRVQYLAHSLDQKKEFDRILESALINPEKSDESKPFADFFNLRDSTKCSRFTIHLMHNSIDVELPKNSFLQSFKYFEGCFYILSIVGIRGHATFFQGTLAQFDIFDYVPLDTIQKENCVTKIGKEGEQYWRYDSYENSLAVWYYANTPEEKDIFDRILEGISVHQDRRN